MVKSKVLIFYRVNRKHFRNVLYYTECSGLALSNKYSPQFTEKMTMDSWFNMHILISISLSFNSFLFIKVKMKTFESQHSSKYNYNTYTARL